jgi:hypothetical protein
MGQIQPTVSVDLTFLIGWKNNTSWPMKIIYKVQISASINKDLLEHIYLHMGYGGSHIRSAFE